jgi:hypothetical protein
MVDAVASPFVMIGAREALLTGAAHLERQIIALESAVSSNPGFAFDMAKTLLESACKAVLTERACNYETGWDLPKLLKETLSQIQLVPSDFVAEAEVTESLRKTAGGLQTTIQGICELRNTQGFASHGKDPAFQELESVQALLVARAADAIVSFMFRAHQGYQRHQAPARLSYADHSEFNDFVDDSNAPVQVFSEEFAPSRVLFEMAPEPYRVYLTEFLQGDQDVAEPAKPGEVP